MFFRVPRFAVFFAFLFFALATTEVAGAFCGFYVSGADTKLFNNATQVVLMRDGTRTVLSMQNNYQGPPSDFAMVVPVPVILQKENVKTLPREVFAKVDQLDAPRLVEYWEQDPCSMPQREERNKSASPPSPAPAKAAGGKGGADLGVTVEAQFTVGEYEVLILSAKDAAGLETWLTQEKYKIPDGSSALFRPYVAAGSKFFVARVDAKKVTFNEKGMATLSPLRFYYDSPEFSLPVKLGLVNSNGTQDLIVHILAKNQRYEVANYPNVTIPTNFDVAENARDKFGSFYASLFDRTIEKNPKAVITEYSWDASTCDPCPGPALSYNDFATLGADVTGPNANSPGGTGAAPPPSPPPPGGGGGKMAPGRGRFSFMPSGYVITRLHARYSKDSLGEDLVFKAAAAIVGGREVRRPPPSTAKENEKDQGSSNTPDLEHGASPSSVNNFQGRYAIRHPWGGPVTCKEPHRGIWGGPPSGVSGSSSPKAAKELAFVPRDEKLASFVRSEISELGIKGEGLPVSAVMPAGSAVLANVTTPTTDDASTSTSGADGGDGKPIEKRGCMGCTSSSSRSPIGGTIAFGLVMTLLLRRRSLGKK